MTLPRRLLALLLCAALVGSPVAAAQEDATPATTPQISARAAILVDLADGEVVFDRNVHEHRRPASLTKVVTALVVRDRYRLDEVVRVNDRAAAETGSRLGLETGMEITVRELLYGLLVRSGNDAATALAEHHPGGHEHFIELMNEKARALGAFDSSFRNAHGLDAESHYSSAWDMAIFARQLLADPLLADIVSTPTYTVRTLDGTELDIRNGNELVRGDEGAVGVKTGFTREAGRCLIAAAEGPNGMLLTVVLDAEDHYADTRALLDHGNAHTLPEEAGSAPQADGQPEDADAGEVLSAPPAPPQLHGGEQTVAQTGAPAQAPGGLWALIMAALALATVVTLVHGRRSGPLQEAAGFHAYLQPLVEARQPGRERRRDGGTAAPHRPWT